MQAFLAVFDIIVVAVAYLALGILELKLSLEVWEVWEVWGEIKRWKCVEAGIAQI